MRARRPLWSRPAAALLTALALPVAAVSVAAGGCGTRPSGEPVVSCKICPNTGGTSNQINDLAAVPRMNFKGQFISADIGAYSMYECRTPGSGCELKLTSWDVQDVLEGDQENPRNVANYLQGYLTHVAFAVFMALLSISIGIGLLLGRYCCCCCDKQKQRCIGGCCGSRFPTQRPDASTGATRCQRWCSFGGMVPTKEGLEGMTGVPAWAYSKQARLATIALFLSFLFCTFLFIGLGYFNGVRAVPGALSDAVIDGPDSLLALVGSLESPLGDFLAGVASDTLVGALVDFNHTFNAAVDLQDVLVQSDCVLDSVETLPSVGGLTDFIFDTQRRLYLLVTRVAQIVPDLEADLAHQESNLRDHMDANLVAPMDEVTIAVEAASNATLDMHALLVGFDADVLRWTGLSEGGTASIHSDLSALSSIPDLAATEALTTQGPSSLSQLGDFRPAATPPSNMAPADRTALLAALSSFRTTYSSMPDYALTASHIRSLEQNLDEFIHRDAIRTLMDSMATTTASLSNLDSAVSQLHNATDAFHTEVGSLIDFSGASHAIDRLNSTLFSEETAPDLMGLQREIDGLVRPLTTRIIPCLTKLFSYVDSINATLVQLPQSMGVAANILDQINSTVDDAQGALDTIRDSMGEFEAQRTQLNLVAFQHKLDEMRQGITGGGGGGNNSLANSTYFDSIEVALNATRALNLSALSAQMDQLNSTLHEHRLAPGAEEAALAFEGFQAGKTALLAALERVRDDTALYDQGYCSDDNTVLCRVDADCDGGGGGATCEQVGQKRCKLQPSVPCTNDGSTTQDADLQCTGVTDDYCLVSPHRVSDLIAQLEAASNGAPALVLTGSSLSAQLNAIETAALAIATEAVEAQLLLSASKLGALNTSDFHSSLDQVGDHFSSFNLTQLSEQVSTLNDSVASIDYSDTSEQIRALNRTLVDVQTEQVEPLRDSRKVIYAFQQMLHVKFSEYARTLSASSLRSVRATEGVAGLIGAIASVVDDASSYLRDNQDSFTFTTSLVADTAEARDKIGILLGQGSSGREAASLGALYTLTQLVDSTSYLRPSDAEWSARDTYDEGSLGAYGGNKKCLTEECLVNTVEKYMGSSGGGGGATIESMSDGQVPVPLTREQLQSIPLVLPLLVVLLALAGAATYKYTAWSSCFSSAALCMLFPVAALMFLLSALLFPALLATGDVCRGLENVALQYVQAQGDRSCTSLLGGTGSAHACALESLNDTQIVIDVPQALVNIMGGRCGAAEDSIARTWTGFRDSVESWPQRTLDDFLDTQMAEAQAGGEGDANDQLIIRSPLQAPLRQAARSSGVVFRDFVERIGSDTLNCASLHAAWKGVKAPFCCAVGTTLYWSLGAVYLLAFSLLLCGFPAILLGRKRFPTHAWGPFALETPGYPEGMCAVPGVVSDDDDGALPKQAGGADGADDGVVYVPAQVERHESDDDSDGEGGEGEASVVVTPYGPTDTAVPDEGVEQPPAHPRPFAIVCEGTSVAASASSSVPASAPASAPSSSPGSRVSRLSRVSRGDDTARSHASPSGVVVMGLSTPQSHTIEMSPHQRAYFIPSSSSDGGAGAGASAGSLVPQMMLSSPPTPTPRTPIMSPSTPHMPIATPSRSAPPMIATPSRTGALPIASPSGSASIASPSRAMPIASPSRPVIASPSRALAIASPSRAPPIASPSGALVVDSAVHSPHEIAVSESPPPQPGTPITPSPIVFGSPSRHMRSPSAR